MMHHYRQTHFFSFLLTQRHSFTTVAPHQRHIINAIQGSSHIMHIKCTQLTQQTNNTTQPTSLNVLMQFLWWKIIDLNLTFFFFKLLRATQDTYRHRHIFLRWVDDHFKLRLGIHMTTLVKLRPLSVSELPIIGFTSQPGGILKDILRPKHVRGPILDLSNVGHPLPDL